MLYGNMVANDPPLHGKRVNVADREYFATVVAGGRATISKPLKARTTGQPAVLMAVAAVPLTLMGGQAGILQGERRWFPLAAV